jgi:hypothetical protein
MTRYGLHWRKLDLHVHTPASKDYVGSPITPDQFVVKALVKGLHGIAVTDHNSGEWIDVMVAAAKGTALTVFPGVEISVPGGKHGVHIIALFDADATTKTIENLLSKLGFNASDYGSLEALSSMAPDAVVEAIHEAGGLAVLAHADSSKGVLSDIVGQTRNKVMNCDHLSAVEIVNVSKTAPYCSGNDQNYKRKLAYYRASDNPVPGGGSGHSVDGVAARYSWFKSDGLSLDALKQVFNDPDQRIKCDEESAAIPDRMYPRILGLTVSQGFLKGMSFEFHEGLNSVIGGKGVGKSLLIEVLRFGLGQPSQIQDIAKDMNGKLAQQLRTGGQILVRVQLEADQEIEIVRTYDGGQNPIKATYAISGKKVPGDIAQLFPVLAYSQTETLEIAKDPNAQLSLIDSFLDLVTIESQIAVLEASLLKSDTAVAEAEAASERLEKAEKELETHEEKIGQLDRAQKSKEFDALQGLKPKTDLMAKVEGFAEDIEGAVDGISEAVKQCVVPKVPAALAGDREAEKLVDELAVEVKKLVTSAKEIEADAEKLAKRARGATGAWDKVVSAKKREYETFVKTQGGERQALLARKLALEDQKPALARNVSDLKARIASLPKLRAERTKLLAELDVEVEMRHEMRKQKFAVLTAASHDRLELTLTKGGERSQFVELVSRLKTGSKLQETTVDQICANVEPRALLIFVHNNDASGLAKRSGISITSANTLLGHLRASADATGLLGLQHGELLRDLPRIRYKKDDGKYYELADLSVGQKCTSLLIIALSDGTRPIIIDQPEDALDITSVYQDVTLQLRERKHARQFIVTTHNPTVAVAADTDQFHVLSATASQATLTTEGAIDRPVVRRAVIQHLEGGEEPFALKTKKYGLAR